MIEARHPVQVVVAYDFSPSSEQALARAIEVVLTSPREWRTAASSAAGRVRLAYAGHVVSAQLEQMYAEMIE